MFVGLSNLNILDLSHNSIQTVTSKVFSNSQLLQRLSLESNLINFISNNEFHDFKAFNYLSLVNNRLSYIDANFLQGCNSLKTLCLGRNLFPSNFYINTGGLISLTSSNIFATSCAPINT
jgi:hypothetical protein